MTRPSLRYIFLTFLKIGATSYGGYMPTVAMVKKQVVDIDRRLDDDDIMDMVSLASMLPGPMAVNTVSCVGYRLRGAAGAAASFSGILLPSLLLVILISYGYFLYGDIPGVKSFFAGVIPAVTALIVSVGAGMARKGLKTRAAWVIAAISALSLALVGGFTLTLCLIVASGVAGVILLRDTSAGSPGEAHGKGINRRGWVVAAVIILALLCVLIWGGQVEGAPRALQALTTFSGLSLTLFGGGYVVIPALHELFVDQLGWLTPSEFADGIAIGQVTPGPIFITAAFIGYKVAGVGGAVLATAGMFIPPALLAVTLSRFVNELKHSRTVAATLRGVRAAVIGMILASSVTIGRTIDWSVLTFIILAAALYISFRTRISPAWIILGSGAVSFIIYSIPFTL